MRGANGDNPTDLELIDVTGDNLADVVVVNASSDDICVLTADGAGGLNLPVCFSTLTMSGGNQPIQLAAGDVNGDLEPDILVTCTTDDVVIFAGVAGGATFAAPVSIGTRDGSAGDRPYGIEIGDINQDMIVDIVTTNVSSHDITVLLGQGMGAFASPMVFEAQYGYDGNDPRSPRLADVDGDGAIDVVFASDDDSDIVIVPGFGDGRLAPSQTVFVGNDTRSLILADYTGDGRVDMAASDYAGDAVERFVQNPSRQFTRSTYSSYTCCYYGRELISLAQGNLDNDSDIDIVAISETDADLVRKLNNGSGAFSTNSYTSIEYGTEMVTLVDVTSDTVLDAITVVPSADLIYIRPGNGAGDFGGASSLSTRVSTQGDEPKWVTAAELTGDTVNDIVSGNYQTNDLTLFVGIGGGAFSAPIIIAAAFGATNVGVRNVQFGDFNGDGIRDLATVNQFDDSVSVILGFGAGDFAAPQTFAVGSEPWALTIGDFNDDGLDDIATANYAGDDVSVLLSQGHP